MDFETALSFVNDIIATKAKKKLRSPEIAILKGTWQGITYEQMADSSPYSANYLMRDIGPKFWRLLSEVLGENVTKNNLRVVLENAYPTSNLPNSLASINDSEEIDLSIIINQDIIADSVNQFYGREQELSLLRQWVIDEHCHLIGLWGLSGVGKTVLMKKLGEQVKDQFEIVIWRSLIDAPSLKKLVYSILPSSSAWEQEEKFLPQLLKLLRSHSCLILLDGVESILQPGKLCGKYRPGYENYATLFQYLRESYHQSCMILSGLESPAGIFQSEQHSSAIHSLQILGLAMPQARYILEEVEGLMPSASWSKLIECYQGNPTLLTIISKIIKELFNGNVEEFLAQNSLVVGETNRLLDKTLQRLSVLETEILYWFIGESKPILLSEIQTNIPISIYPTELIETIESLQKRSLIEIDTLDQRSIIIVPPIIKEFVANSFIAQIGQYSANPDRKSRFFKQQKTIELSLSSQETTYLRQWRQNLFESDWQPIDAIFAASGKMPFRLRSTFNLREAAWIKRFKQIELNAPKPTAILLLVAVNQEKQAYKICVQVQPVPEQQLLPPDLCLSLENEEDQTLAQITSESQDNFIQLPYFRGSEEESFKISLTLNSANHEEKFVI